MPLQEIRAHWLCDGCGKPFSVKMEPPNKFPRGWTLYDSAVDAVRGSIDYQGPNQPNGCGGMSAVEGDNCLCGHCDTLRVGRQP